MLLNTLSEEFQTTKTEIVEKAIEHFSRESRKKQNRLMDFAGKLQDKEAEKMITSIRNDKNSKEFSLDL